MPQNTNCSIAHRDREPGPCKICCKYDATQRYVHLCQKQHKNPEFYDFAHSHYAISDQDCICRKCEAKLFRDMGNKCDDTTFKTASKRRSLESDICASNSQEEMLSTDTNTSHCYLLPTHQCKSGPTISTEVDPLLFQTCFSNADCVTDSIQCVQVSLCSQHYREYRKFCLEKRCCICDRLLRDRTRSVCIAQDKQDLFNAYISEELSFDRKLDSDSMVVCLFCYRSFNLYSKSDNLEQQSANSDKLLMECLEHFDSIDPKSVDISNVDRFCFRIVLAKVVDDFLSYSPLLLQSLYSDYCDHVNRLCSELNFSADHDKIHSIKHDIKWFFRMLKSSLGSLLQVRVPEVKKSSRMIFRTGTDFMRVAHKQLYEHQKSIDALQAVNIGMQTKLDELSKNLQTLTKVEYLEKALDMTKNCVKSYVSSSVATNAIPDIHCFDVRKEIKKLNPDLWNFIYRLTANEIEEKSVSKSMSLWENSHLGIDDSSASRLFPRLFIASCIFNTQSSKCVEPLHLLMTEVLDKYSGSSTELLAITNRVGATVSKDTLKRFISNRCVQIDKQPNILSSDSFAVASFDNLDKNQKYAFVGTGSNKSGFHGTTIQAVIPKPSVKCEQISDDHGIEFDQLPADLDLSGSMLEQILADHGTEFEQILADHGTEFEQILADHGTECAEISVDTTDSEHFSDNCGHGVSSSKKSGLRSIPSDLLKALKEPNDNIGEPSTVKENRFTRLTLDDFALSEREKRSWDNHISDLSNYGFVKSSIQKHHVVIPGLKTFLAHNQDDTEISEFYSIAVLDETADSKATVELTLNILYDKFNVGSRIQYLVVVGDGKSYDILIKLKSEYGSALNWVLAYPGDWHILKNILPIFITIYYDAGLKELATKYHHGATLKVLVDCTRFVMTHRFFIHVWEAMFRYQIDCFMMSNSSVPRKFQNDFDEIICKILQNINITDVDCNQNQDDILDSAVWDSVLEYRDRYAVLLQDVKVEFSQWRNNLCRESETFRFWDNFIHEDFMSYLGLYLAIRDRNWNLRNASLKKLSCLFTAFDRHNYMRMIPYHFADLLTYPQSVIQHFHSGCFAVSMSGDSYYSVALDEAHEMEINLKTKKAINAFSMASLAAMTYYLPYRAETLHNLKFQLDMDVAESNQRRELSKTFIKNEEQTILQYIAKFKLSSLFDVVVGKSLQHIFSHVLATRDQVDSLLNYRQYGTEDMNNYIQCFLIRVSDVSVKQPQRKRRNLKTFSSAKVTVHKQKKEIKDNKTVISCLRKQIAFSKLTSEPVTDLDQFISLPRAICDSEGIPLKGQKSLLLHHLRSRFGGAFISAMPAKLSEGHTAVILEGMFMINTNPVQQHKTFGDYAKFLFERWVVKSQKQYSASEIHVVFDHPNRHGCSPKDVERSRRDSSHGQVQGSVFDSVSTDTCLPSCWRTFLGNRENKRKFVNFLSYHFLHLASSICKASQCTVIVAGGFDDDNQDKALACMPFDSYLLEFVELSCDHEEGDTRVWFHASKSSACRVIIYSPDTDTFFIGLPIIQQFTASVFLQTKDTPYEKTYIDMKMFVSLLSNDLTLYGIKNLELCIQMLYICSGCDFVSFFHGCGKKSFLEGFLLNIQFITGELSLVSMEEDGLCSFYRLIASVYFAKHRAAFQPSCSASELYQTIDLSGNLHCHTTLIQTIRERMWDRIQSEDDMLPTADALKLHWLRSCWVFKYWRQALDNSMKLDPIDNCGWAVKSSTVSVLWDSDVNIDKVEKTVKWYTKGCSCKSGCTTNRCSCKKSNGFCGPGCKCQNCQNIRNHPSTSELLDDIDTFSESSSIPELESDNESDGCDDTLLIAPSDEIQQYWDTFGFLTGAAFAEESASSMHD